MCGQVGSSGSGIAVGSMHCCMREIVLVAGVVVAVVVVLVVVLGVGVSGQLQPAVVVLLVAAVVIRTVVGRHRHA